MIAETLRHVIRFVLLVLAQVWLLNNIHLYALFTPQIYPLFLLLLPFSVAPRLLLLIGFAGGLVLDVFYHTGAIHASACVTTAALRPLLLSLLKPAGGYQPEDHPSISRMGFLWFFTYVSILLLVHHFWLFAMQTFSFRQIFFTTGRIVLSTAAAITITLILQYLTYRKPKPTFS